jgi:hypothetical protein
MHVSAGKLMRRQADSGWLLVDRLDDGCYLLP